jgi:hypothetical protein
MAPQLPLSRQTTLSLGLPQGVPLAADSHVPPLPQVWQVGQSQAIGSPQPSSSVPHFPGRSAQVFGAQHWSSPSQTSVALEQQPLMEQITPEGQTQSPS